MLSFRQLAKSPGYTAVAVLTLALTIGATTAIFSILDAVVLRPLAFPASEQLVAVRCAIPSLSRTYPTLPVNARFYSEWRAVPAFTQLALFTQWTVTLTGDGEPVRLSALAATSNLLATLRIAPAFGQGFTAVDDQPGEASRALISERLWRAHFHADPSVLGRSVMIDSKPVTIIGVMPASFRLPNQHWSEPDVLLTRPFGPDELNEIVGRFNYDVVGRLAPNISLTEAASQLDVVAANLVQLSGGKTEVRSSLTPLREIVVGPVSRGVWILFAAIGAVLLLACLNLSLLGLARAETRSHEAAIRAALGASRQRLFAHALSESLFIALVGGTLGCVVAWWGLDALVRLAPANMPRLDEAVLDWRVLSFALVTTCLATVLSGLIPAWQASRNDAASVYLSRASRTSTANRVARRVRTTFVAVETGLGTLLLAAAALFIGSFARLLHADVGFHAPQVVTTSLVIPAAKYRTPEDRRGYFRRALESVSRVPGVTAAAVTNALPLTGETWIDAFSTPGDSRPAFERPAANVRFVTPDYFATLNIPIRSGRTFREADGDNVVIVSAHLAAELWPGQDATGRKIVSGENRSLEVIGVVGDVRANVDRQPVAFVYQPHWAWGGFSQATLAVRFAGTPARTTDLHHAIRAVDADVPLQTFRSMDDLFASAVSPRRFQMQLFTAFALAALALASLGIYGVVLNTVGQRTRELGIRLAFGAQPAQLSRMVLRQELKPVALGLISGLGLALIGGRLLSAFLYETSPREPLALMLGPAVLLVAATAACWLPARRATKVDPITALRAE